MGKEPDGSAHITRCILSLKEFEILFFGLLEKSVIVRTGLIVDLNIINLFTFCSCGLVSGFS
jgi:hypothetical protein